MLARSACLSVLCVCLLGPGLRGQESLPHELPSAAPAAVGMSADILARIDEAVQQGIQKGQLPGAVVLVLRQGKVVYRKAFGLRRRSPREEQMTAETVFDLASLTKPIVTATAMLQLLEKGKLRLSDPVSRYLPGFTEERQRKITIEQLLLHTSGLIPDNALKDYQDGPGKAKQRLFALKPTVEPGSKFMYSDVGFMLLGEIVERVSGESLDAYARKHIFAPLGMSDTTYKPGPELAARTAPTEKRNGRWLQGQVHDPRAAALGGVAGHAGLFSTADDLAIFAQMLLNKGNWQGRQVLSPATVRLLTTPRDVPGGQRTLGWDANTAYSSNRGTLFPVGGFGHTGFTGTSLWIDPASQTAVIFLSHRVHPSGKGSVTRLRGQVATIVAASIKAPPLPGGKGSPPH